MQDETRKPEGLSPEQQLFLMGKVEALLDAVAVLAMTLSGEQQRELREFFGQMREDTRSTERLPAQYRTTFRSARHQVFHSLMLALADRPMNDNEG